MSNSPTALPSESVSHPKQSRETKQLLIASALSALVPGVGQLRLGQRRKGIGLLIFFAALVSCIGPLRLGRFFAALIPLAVTWLGLAFYAPWAALFRGPYTQRPSRWWLLAIPFTAYLGFNAVFTPVFLASGFRAHKFSSSAMEPTLFVGDQFISDKNYYRHHALARNDLVVLRRNDYVTVKRVVALGGDTIEGKNRKNMLNGQLLDEPFIQHELNVGSNPQLDSFGPITVPAGKYFVMGDNRDVSLDSRTPDFGLTDAQAIVGRPLYIYRSPADGRRGKTLH